MTSTGTLTLADFLKARIAEDAMAVRSVDRVHWSELAYMTPGYTLAKALAECEAKRRIVELHQSLGVRFDKNGATKCQVCSDDDMSWWRDDDSPEWPCATLQALALPYADHPDYRDEWRP